MKILTLMQPYGSLLFCPTLTSMWKEFETRGWRPSQPIDTLGIHTSAKMSDAAKALCETEPFKQALAAGGFTSWKDLPLGKIIGTVKPVEFVRTERALELGLIEEAEFKFGDYGPKRWAWRFTDAKLLPVPIKASGAQSIWIYEGELA